MISQTDYVSLFKTLSLLKAVMKIPKLILLPKLTGRV